MAQIEKIVYDDKPTFQAKMGGGQGNIWRWSTHMQITFLKGFYVKNAATRTN